MRIVIDQEHLLPGTRLEGEVLSMPAEGGGILLPELKGEGPRWLNLEMTVQSPYAQALNSACTGRTRSPG